MKSCPQCDKQLKDDAQFCSACSARQEQKAELPLPDFSAFRVRLNRFDDPQIDALALDHFPEVQDKFRCDLRRDEKINLLLDYCRRHPDAAARLADLLLVTGVTAAPVTQPASADAHGDSKSTAFQLPTGPIRERWALLVGVDYYVDPSFPNLRFCVNDVLALQATLEAAGYIVVALHDAAPDEYRLPTRDNVAAELARICRAAGQDDLIWVHFSCHGKLVERQPALLTRESRAPTLTKKALRLTEVEQELRSSPARRRVLTLDTCHTGVEIGRDLADPDFIRYAYELAEGFALLAASTSQQVAQEWEAKEHGVFTYFLLEGLDGKADRANKGLITVNDLTTHTLDGLRRWNITHGGIRQELTGRVEGLGDIILVDLRTDATASGVLPIQTSVCENAAPTITLSIDDASGAISKDATATSSRYLNAGFFPAQRARNCQPLPVDCPMALDGGPYRLGVNIGEFWGPGMPGIPIPDDMLTPHLEESINLEMDVAAHSLDVHIDPPLRKLQLAKKGNSALVFFDLAFRKPGPQAIDVDLIFRGHILQSRRVEIFVLAHSGDPVPRSVWPVQDSYITFTRTAALDSYSLRELNEKPSQLTIVAERDLDYNRIGLRFYSIAGKDLGFQQSTLTEANLTTAMAAVRGQLAKTMQAYSGTIGSTREVLEKHLGQLADIGRSFYLALLPGLAGHADIKDEGQQLKVDMQPGMIVQVAPLSAQLGVPWELLYERKIESYREERIKLCSTFLDHGPAAEDCPGFGDPTVVCPHGFWGYRYIIEQLPHRVEPHATLPNITLPMKIYNETPLRFSAIVYAGFNQLQAHLDALRALASQAQLELVRFETLNDVHTALSQTNSPADVIYFYTHGGSDLFGKPYLEIGTGDQIKFNDLDAWGVNLEHHQPLVVLNACESADYSPDSFENLVRFFCNKKAAGVIGTHCEVKEALANAIIILFFRAFFKQVGAGQALFEARQKLLHDTLDPRGLAYSLFAAAEVKLNNPVTNG